MGQLLKYLKKSVPQYFLWLTVFIIIQFIFRIIETLYLSSSNFTGNNFLKHETLGFASDLVLIFKFTTLFFLIPYLLINAFSQKLGNFIAVLILSVYSFFQFALVGYFKNTSTLLDESLFQYKREEILLIIKNSSTTTIENQFTIILILALVISAAGLVLSKKLVLPRWLINFFIVLAVTSTVFGRHILPNSSNYDHEIDYYLTTNKTGHFVESCFNYYYNSEYYSSPDADKLKNISQKYQSYYPNYKYVKNDYPLLRESSQKNVLEPFFNLKSEKPNFVFIILEGMGKTVSGSNADLGSFTPFLDSIESLSLSWENFLSNSERTFGAIPGLFGSLPYGKRGYMEMTDKMPSHLTFLSLANTWGYYSSFWHGGWVEFDNMETFFKYNNLNFTNKNFANYPKMQTAKNNFTWGFGDDVLFKRSLEIKDSLKNTTPFIDIYLTLSMHSPWIINDQQKYMKMAEERYKTINTTQLSKQNFDAKKDVFSCIMYCDDAMRNYFNTFSKTEAFQNTIFIIVGDHATHELSLKSDIDIFHVPLIIYSPMLKSPKKIKGVSTLNNIAPTLIALMSKYKINQPDTIHWVTNELDTASVFQNNEIHPFMGINRKIEQLVMGNYYLHRDKLYLLGDGFETTRVRDYQKIKEMKTYLELYKSINNYVCNEKKLMPIELYQKYTGFTPVENQFYDFENPDITLNGSLNQNNTFAFSGNFSYFLPNNSQYLSFVRNYSLDKDFKSLRFIIEFKYLCTDTLNYKNVPGLTFSIFDKTNRRTVWENVQLPVLKTHNDKVKNNWQPISIIKEFDCTDKNINIVIWNHNGANSYFDELSITILGKHQ